MKKCSKIDLSSHGYSGGLSMYKFDCQSNKSVCKFVYAVKQIKKRTI